MLIPLKFPSPHAFLAMEAPEEITGACSLPRTRRKIVIKIRPDTKWKNAEEKDEVPAPSSSPMASQSANPATAGVYYFNKRKLEEKLNVLATIQGGSEKLSTLSDSSSDEENGHGNFSLIEPLQSLNLSEQTSCDK